MGGRASPVFLTRVVVVSLLGSCFVLHVNAASVGSTGVTSALPAGVTTFLMQLRAEVDRDRLMYVSRNSIVQQQVRDLSTQVSDMTVKVNAIQDLVNATSGPHIQGQQTPGTLGSCPSGCQVASDLNRLNTHVVNTRRMAQDSVRNLQDHVTDMKTETEKQVQALIDTDHQTQFALSRQDTMLHELTQKVIDMEARFKSTSVTNPNPFSSTFSPILTSHRPTVVSSSHTASPTSSAVLADLSKLVDSLVQEVKDLRGDQSQALVAQNSRLAQIERSNSQLRQDNSDMLSTLKTLQREVVSNSQRLLATETEASETSNNLNEGLTIVNASMSIMGDRLRQLQARDTVHSSSMQQLASQQTSLSARAAGNTLRVTSLASDLTHLDHRLSVISALIQDEAQDIKALNKSVNDFLVSSSAPKSTTSSAVSTPATTATGSGPTSAPSTNYPAHTGTHNGPAVTVTAAPGNFPFPSQRPSPTFSAPTASAQPVTTKVLVFPTPKAGGSSATRPVFVAPTQKPSRVSTTKSPSVAVPTQRPAGVMGPQPNPTMVVPPSPSVPGVGSTTHSPVVAVPTQKPSSLTSSAGFVPTPAMVVPTRAPSATTLDQGLLNTPNMVVPTMKPSSMTAMSVNPTPGSIFPTPSVSGFQVPTQSPVVLVPTLQPQSGGSSGIKIPPSPPVNPQRESTQAPVIHVPTHLPSLTPGPVFVTPDVPTPRAPSGLSPSQQSYKVPTAVVHVPTPQGWGNFPTTQQVPSTAFQATPSTPPPPRQAGYP